MLRSVNYAQATTILKISDKDGYGFTDYFDSELFRVGTSDTIAAMRVLLENRSLDKLGKVVGQDRFEARKIIGEIAIKDFDWLQSIYLHEKDVPAYLKIVETFGVDPEHCERIAIVFEKQGELASALEWAEKGLALKSKNSKFRYSSGEGLTKIHRRLLSGLGRRTEAFQSAWSEFEKHPSVYTYREVVEFVESEISREWYEKARDLVLKQDSEHLSSTFAFLTEYGEIDRLRDLIERTADGVLEQISYTTLKETARKIEQEAPLAAAKLYKAEAIEILSRAKAKAYPYALENLLKVKTLYEAIGRTDLWIALAAGLQADHKRKSSFIGEFNRIVSGEAGPKRPTFLERIGKHLTEDGPAPSRGKY